MRAPIEIEAGWEKRPNINPHFGGIDRAQR